MDTISALMRGENAEGVYCVDCGRSVQKWEYRCKGCERKIARKEQKMATERKKTELL